MFLKPNIFARNRPRMNEQVNWFHVDGSLIPVKKKKAVSKISEFMWTITSAAAKSLGSVVNIKKNKITIMIWR